MSTYTVFPIDPPASVAQLAAYKALRLTALQTDPHTFISTYAREVAFSDDVWRQRLDSSSKRTLIASVLNSPLSSLSHRPCGDVDKTELTVESEWIGMASIVGPSDMVAIPSVLAPFREAGVGDNWEVYGLYAMWVHPAHRGEGVGAQLVNACLEWARTNVDSKFLSEHSGDLEKAVVLLVYDNNVAGRAFYSRAGFIDLQEVSAEEGERWMMARV